VDNAWVASGSRVLALRLAAGQPGSRVRLLHALGDQEGLRPGDTGTVLWIDDEIHLEMDAGHLVAVSDPEALERVSGPGSHLPGVPSR
jgi:hypothetical protein